MCVCARERECVCARAGERGIERESVCVCACVCERDSEVCTFSDLLWGVHRVSFFVDGQTVAASLCVCVRERERGREGERECVCACVCERDSEVCTCSDLQWGVHRVSFFVDGQTVAASF